MLISYVLLHLKQHTKSALLTKPKQALNDSRLRSLESVATHHVLYTTHILPTDQPMKKSPLSHSQVTSGQPHQQTGHSKLLFYSV